MVKVIPAILASAIISTTGIVTPAFAADPEGASNDILMMYIDSYAAYKNGDYREIYEGEYDVSPILFEDRTLIPARFVGEEFGCEVSWNAAKKETQIRNAGHEIVCRINDQNAEVDGKSIQIDVPAQIVNDRTMLPLRFLAESLGKTVDYYNGLILIGSNTSVENAKQSDLDSFIWNNFKCNMRLKKELTSRKPVNDFHVISPYDDGVLKQPSFATNGYYRYIPGNIPVNDLPEPAKNCWGFTIYNDRIYYLEYYGGSDDDSPYSISSCDLNGQNTATIVNDATFLGSALIYENKLYYNSYLPYSDWALEDHGPGEGNLCSIDLTTGEKSIVVQGDGSHFHGVTSIYKMFDDIIIYCYIYGENANYSQYMWCDITTGEKGIVGTEGYSYQANFKNPKIHYWNNTENTIYFYTSNEYNSNEIRMHNDLTGEDYPIIYAEDYAKGGISILYLSDDYIYYLDRVSTPDHDERGYTINGNLKINRAARPDVQ